MALRALMLRKKLEEKKKLLSENGEKMAAFATREAELERAIEEAETEEEKQAVEDEVAKFETEKTAAEEEAETLQGEIDKIEADLGAIEQAAPTNRNKKPEGETIVMRRRNLWGMTYEERDALFAREDVKTFLGQIRAAIKEKREIGNVGLLIPEVLLPMLREATEASSKLISRVNRRAIKGKARQNIAGTIGEGIWTEMCAKLNELDLVFNNVEMDGYKVGAFIAICNATLEDSNENLAAEIIAAIGKAIGKAIDKAIVFGTGVKMPLGFVTRLAQTTSPFDYPATARPWVDLHTSNIITGTGKTGKALFKEIALNTKVIMNDFDEEDIVWIMNKKTHLDLVAESIDTNMNATIVAGMQNTMPVVGGDIVELSFMADGDIAFGYLDLYLLVERDGVTMAQSDQVRFLEEQTVFKGSARYDGTPVIAEAFGIMNIKSAAPTTTATFAQDTANA